MVSLREHLMPATAAAGWMSDKVSYSTLQELPVFVTFIRRSLNVGNRIELYLKPG